MGLLDLQFVFMHILHRVPVFSGTPTLSHNLIKSVIFNRVCCVAVRLRITWFSDWASQVLKITVLITEQNTLCIAGSTE